MRIQGLLPVAGALLFAGAAIGQTVPADPSAPAQFPAPQPAAPVPGLPAPTPVTGPLPAQPGYGRQVTPTQAQPVATPTQPPVVVPGQTTAQAPYAALPPYQPYGIPDEDKVHHAYGSTYIPVDSWVYPALVRLYGLGYVDTMYLGFRPYTRQSVLHMLDASRDSIVESNSEEAQDILVKLDRELAAEVPDAAGQRGTVYGPESYYVRVMGVDGLTLRDSWHLGQTINNDYGRPYEQGINTLLGASSITEFGRFSLYVRGEYQHSPGAPGYNVALAQTLSAQDGIAYTGGNLHQATIPTGPIGAVNPFRLQEAVLSFNVLGHEISGGKSDLWLGPGTGGAVSWSNNAEDIYSFRIDRIEPLHIPYLSAIIGPIRYEFVYGSLKGHSDPNHPYVHAEKFSLRPSVNFEFGFERTVIFGGAGHEPVTLHTFLHSFFNTSDTNAAIKSSPQDPGARYSSFDMSYRLPFLRKYVTFVADSISHDDVTPPSAPRRASFRTGLYLSQIPGARKFDFRVEAVDTDPITSRSTDGFFVYDEGIQVQGYTNKGYIFGDWIGREGKGGQAWLTYHLSGNEYVQIEYLNKKNDKDFSGGTTQNEFKAQLLKRFDHNNLEVNAWVQYEKFKAPIYLPGAQTNGIVAAQLTWFPGLRSSTLGTSR